jgi:hypothetical protein
VTLGPLGYGRYNDDPEHVGCPRARSDMTPCIARDGSLALADDQKCVGCAGEPANLRRALRDAVGRKTPTVYHIAAVEADRLRDLVREVTAVKAERATPST